MPTQFKKFESQYKISQINVNKDQLSFKATRGARQQAIHGLKEIISQAYDSL
jgi:hypothetical protein